jgi:hypothetical protein
MMNYFYCYDGQMMRKLKEKDVRYITRALTVGKLQKFWLYEITPYFQSALKEISEEKE